MVIGVGWPLTRKASWRIWKRRLEGYWVKDKFINRGIVMRFRSASRLCVHCGKTIFFYVEIADDEFPDCVEIVCPHCRRRNRFEGQGASLPWGGVLDAPPEGNVQAKRCRERLEVHTSRARAEAHALNLLVDFQYEFSDSILPMGDIGQMGIKEKLAEEMVRFDVKEKAEAPTLILKLTESMESILFQLVGGRLEQWDFEKSQRLRKLIADYAELVVSRA